MEDWEKKYKEALEKFRKDLGKHELVGVNRAYLEDIFPELAESEDEKIRKDIIYYLTINRNQMTPNQDWDCENRWIPWLEKQCGQTSITHKYNVGATIYYNSFGTIKSMVVANVVDTGDGNPMYEDADGSSVFEKDLVEQKPNWSDEDEAMKENIITSLEGFRDAIASDSLVALYNKRIDWLNSLRPQSHWKPSEEQMKELFNMLHRGNTVVLNSLYEDLKAL